jgi:hypothetical protein
VEVGDEEQPANAIKASIANTEADERLKLRKGRFMAEISICNRTTRRPAGDGLIGLPREIGAELARCVDAVAKLKG